MKRPSIRKRILDLLGERADNWETVDSYMTAIEIKKALKDDTKLSSLSSILVKMVKKGTVVRMSGVGPRGGHGYRLGSSSVYIKMTQRMAEDLAREIDRQVLDELYGDLGRTLP